MHHAKKRFGQNFLINTSVIEHIVTRFRPKETDTIIEIGPGQGALTKALLPVCKQLSVIEIDRDLIEPLKESCASLGNLFVYEHDALTFDFNSFEKKPLRVIGNLPYNISTPLLFHLLTYAEHILDMCFMLQKEVVDRLIAQPNTKNYGRLSVMMQYHCDMRRWFNVSADSFRPKPKVTSSIVYLKPYQQKPFTANDEDFFARVVKAAFAQRRKTLHNTLKEIISDKTFEKANIDPIRRAETLSVEEFVRLANTA